MRYIALVYASDIPRCDPGVRGFRQNRLAASIDQALFIWTQLSFEPVSWRHRNPISGRESLHHPLDLRHRSLLTLGRGDPATGCHRRLVTFSLVDS